MQRFILVIAAVLAWNTPLRAGVTPVSYSPDAVAVDAIPGGVATYRSSDAATSRLAGDIVKSATESAPTVLRRASSPDAAALQPDDASGPKRKYLPVLLSALVPGAGELYLGHWKRGVALVAIEAGAWSGYFYKHNQGLDTRSEYEGFADAHWDQRRFIDNHYLVYPTTDVTLAELEDQGRAGSGSGVWPGYSPWVSKEEDKQHYYENIGKYDWYVSGWEDYMPGTRPEDLAPGQVLSKRREEYRGLRGDSNDQLDAATRYIYLSITARVISLVQTTLLVTRSSSGDDMASTDNHWMLRARSRGRDAGEVAFEYWFK